MLIVQLTKSIMSTHFDWNLAIFEVYWCFSPLCLTGWLTIINHRSWPTIHQAQVLQKATINQLSISSLIFSILWSTYKQASEKSHSYQTTLTKTFIELWNVNSCWSAGHGSISTKNYQTLLNNCQILAKLPVLMAEIGLVTRFLPYEWKTLNYLMKS